MTSMVNFHQEGDTMVLAYYDSTAPYVSVGNYAFCFTDCLLDFFGVGVEYRYCGKRSEICEVLHVALVQEGKPCRCGKAMSSDIVYVAPEYEEI